MFLFYLFIFNFAKFVVNAISSVREQVHLMQIMNAHRGSMGKSTHLVFFIYKRKIINT